MTKFIAFKDGVQVQNIDFEVPEYGAAEMFRMHPDCVIFSFPSGEHLPQDVLDYLEKFKPKGD